MSAFLLAVFNDYATADRVRTDLVLDGFPTDRVELTAGCDPGRAALEPADSAHDRFVLYFRALFSRQDEQPYAEQFARCVECGAGVIAVHPRGRIETARATRILEEAGPAEVTRHDVESQTLEFAAARHDKPWARNFWVDSPSDSHCIYCRLYDAFSHRKPVS
jgi:hypothetical protein